MGYKQTHRRPRQRISGANTKHTEDMKVATQKVSPVRKKIKLSHADETRFWSKVDKSGGPDACWLWTAGKTQYGYGSFRSRGKSFYPHRVAWVLTHGQVPIHTGYHGLCVCHRCDVPACCRPDHLFLGTCKDNNRDRKNKWRTARGDKSGSRLHPESRAKGDNHGSRLHPELIARGESHGHSKLTSSQILKIRDMYASGGILHRELAAHFGMSKSTIGGIIRCEIWRHVSANAPLKKKNSP